jgi:pimeloyl-ACP methyl ester carboxylesterase
LSAAEEGVAPTRGRWTSGEAPGWFRRALHHPHRDETIRAAGVEIHVRSWGEPTAPLVVLVHGGGAHAGWWDHVAPAISDAGHHVRAVDLSGHGDSPHRGHYTRELWVEEVGTLVSSSRQSATVIGHSMGGGISLALAASRAADLSRVVVIDAPLRVLQHASPDGTATPAPRRFYPSPEAALERFRTVPPQDRYLGFVMEHVGRQSLRETHDGWTWKHDPRVIRPVGRATAPEDISADLEFVACEHGLLDPDTVERRWKGLGWTPACHLLPNAGHHPMLDEPLALLDVLLRVLARRPAGQHH